MKALTGILFCLISLFITAKGQTPSTSDLIEESIENISEDLTESEIPEELTELLRSPVDLNKGNYRELLRFNIITPLQESALLNHIRIYGKLIEIEELQQIDGFDKKLIHSILPYVTIKNVSFAPPLQQITIRVQQLLQNSESTYPGSKQKILLRSKTTLSSKLSFSFTGEKDQGEEFLTHDKSLFDFNSLNVCYTPDKFINKIIAGDFNVQYGQGLTTWTGLSFGSANNLTGIYKYGRGIIPYSGTDENRFQRGVALSMQKKRIKADIWLSSLAVDATTEYDSINESEYVTTLQTSGYHRTESELKNYHSQKEMFAGLALIYSFKKFSAGITSAYQKFDSPIIKSDDAYKKFRFYGKENYSSGLFYSYTIRNIFVFGENSISKSGGIAFLNGFLISLDPKISIGLLYRSYGRNYISLKSQAFGVNTENADEKGLYVGLAYKLSRTISYSTFTDVFQFDYLKYRVDKPSSGNNIFHQLDYVPNKKFTSQLRFNHKTREINSSVSEDNQVILSQRNSNSLRLNARFKIGTDWDYGMRIEYSFGKSAEIEFNPSGVISQDIFFHPSKKPYSLNFRYSVFNCPDFDNRIYSYENDVPGSFSVPFYYGTGSRFYINIGLKALRLCSLSIKYSATWFEETNDEIATTSSEIKLQLKLTFR